MAKGRLKGELKLVLLRDRHFSKSIPNVSISCTKHNKTQENTNLSFLIFCHESIQFLDRNLQNNGKITIFEIPIQKKSGNIFFHFVSHKKWLYSLLGTISDSLASHFYRKSWIEKFRSTKSLQKWLIFLLRDLKNWNWHSRVIFLSSVDNSGSITGHRKKVTGEILRYGAPKS